MSLLAIFGLHNLWRQQFEWSVPNLKAKCRPGSKIVDGCNMVEANNSPLYLFNILPYLSGLGPLVNKCPATEIRP